MDKRLIERKIERLEDALKAIKGSFPGIKNQEDIAKAIGYSRGGTISDYKNIHKYNEANFKNLLEQLARQFNVNVDYVMKGEGTVFKIDRVKVIDSITGLLNQLRNDEEMRNNNT